LELAFATKSLRQICENNDKAKKELGNESAEKLIHRLADLRAITYVSELIVGNPRHVTYSNKPHFLVDLCSGYSILFCANHVKTPILISGAIDWSKVSRIKIIKIGNDNG
jgi:proteic killer suppression protein